MQSQDVSRVRADSLRRRACRGRLEGVQMN